MTRTNKILIILNVIILIGAVFFINYAETKPNQNQSEEVEIIEDTFSTPLTSIEQMEDEKFNGVVYFGRDTCPNCLTINEFLKKFHEDNPTETIYKFDTEYWKQDSDYESVLAKYEIESIPLLMKFEKGEVIDRLEFSEEVVTKSEMERIITDFFS